MGTAGRLRKTGIAVGAGLVLLGPAAVALAASGTFTGTTAQGNGCGSTFRSPCRVRVKVAGLQVGAKNTGQSNVQWRARCKPGKNVFLTSDTEFWGTLNNHHNLTVRGRYTQSGLSGPKGTYTARDTVTISVHVAHKVTGTIRDSSVVRQHSRVVYRCHTGTVTFIARR
jgi:hypothetical protein